MDEEKEGICLKAKNACRKSGGIKMKRQQCRDEKAGEKSGSGLTFQTACATLFNRPEKQTAVPHCWKYSEKQ